MNQVKCPKCNGTAAIAMRGHLETVRCDHCGWMESGTVYPSEEVSLIGDSQELVEVQIKWSCQSATSSEIVKARQMFRELADIPLSEVLRRAKDSQTYSIGEYSKPIAIELQERAKANGITVLINKSSSC